MGHCQNSVLATVPFHAPNGYVQSVISCVTVCRVTNITIPHALKKKQKQDPPRSPIPYILEHFYDDRKLDDFTECAMNLLSLSPIYGCLYRRCLYKSYHRSASDIFVVLLFYYYYFFFSSYYYYYLYLFARAPIGNVILAQCPPAISRISLGRAWLRSKALRK